MTQATQGHQIVSVKFKETPHRQYDFLTDLALVRGDEVVVDTQYGLAIATVELVIEGDRSNKATKWVIQKIDRTAHNERLERIKKSEELAKERAAILRKMETRRKQIQDETVYEQLAANDPAMATLLAQFKQVGNDPTQSDIN